MKAAFFILFFALSASAMRYSSIRQSPPLQRHDVRNYALLAKSPGTKFECNRKCSPQQCRQQLTHTIKLINKEIRSTQHSFAPWAIVGQGRITIDNQAGCPANKEICRHYLAKTKKLLLAKQQIPESDDVEK